MTVDIAWDVAGDAELASAAAAGDRSAFAGIYDRYADRLHDFCVGMVGVRDAADCVQEAFCMAAVDLPSLRDPDKLRPWLYAIARHQALRTLRARKREMVSDDMPDEPSTEAGPDTLAARNELAALVVQAEGGLTDRDREVLDLAYRHGLTGAELAQALGVSTEAAKKMVQRLRDTVSRSLGALLIARQARAGHHHCPELATVVADWDGQFTILVRKRIARHIESCANCDERRGSLVNPKALLGASPVFFPAPAWLRAHTLTKAQPAVAATATAAAGAHAMSQVTGRLPLLTGKFALWAAAVVAVPAVALGVTAGWPTAPTAPVTPVQISSTLPATSPSLAPTTPPLPSNTPPPQSNTSAQPVPAPADTGGPNSGEQGPPVIQQAPAPVVTPAPQPTAAAPTTHDAAPSAAPTPSAAPAGTQQPSQPQYRHCPDGSTVPVGKGCPKPQAAPPPDVPPAPQAPTRSQCQHVAVPGTPACPNVAPSQTSTPTKTPDQSHQKSSGKWPFN